MNINKDRDEKFVIIGSPCSLWHFVIIVIEMKECCVREWILARTVLDLDSRILSSLSQLLTKY